MGSSRRLALAALAVLVAACVDHPQARRAPAASDVEVGETPLWWPVQDDLLFVVDDSRSMADEQAALAAGFPQLVDVLAQSQGGLPDVHLGVVTADLGDGGAGLPGCTATGDAGVMRGAACPALDGAAYLADEVAADGTRLRNYTGSLDDAFACMTAVGTGGCAIEQPLEAMHRALAPGLGLAPGFLRDDAELLVVIVSDEDDCSVRDPTIFDGGGSAAGRAFACTTEGLVCDEPDLAAPGLKHGCRPRDGGGLYDVGGYVAFLAGLKYDPALVHVAAAIGDDDPVAIGPSPDDPDAPALLPSCTSDAGSATPALRTAAFAGGFGSHGDQSSLCAGHADDLVAGLARFPEWPPVGDPCFRGPVADADPDQPGLQPTCAVTLTTREGTARAETQVVPACDDVAGAPPCWRTFEDARMCATGPTHAGLGLDLGPAAVPPHSRLRWQCVVD